MLSASYTFIRGSSCFAEVPRSSVLGFRGALCGSRAGAGDHSQGTPRLQHDINVRLIEQVHGIVLSAHQIHESEDFMCASLAGRDATNAFLHSTYSNIIVVTTCISYVFVT